jgi:hypothetical protein
MSPSILALTAALLPLPALFQALGLGSQGPRAPLLAAGLLLAALYLGVWLGARPSRFEVSSAGLRLVFPIRSRSIGRADIASAIVVDAREFRDRFGWAARIGVGGLWGGFGWLWTSRRGLLEFYVSRTDGLVVVERRAGRPLLITPRDPAEFVHALGTGAAN